MLFILSFFLFSLRVKDRLEEECPVTGVAGEGGKGRENTNKENSCKKKKKKKEKMIRLNTKKQETRKKPRK